jgi:hypothetical protein
MAWLLKCLLCEARDQDLEGAANPLVRLQEHLMDSHQVSLEELRGSASRPNEEGSEWIYTLPDGRDWLEAIRKAGDGPEENRTKTQPDL